MEFEMGIDAYMGKLIVDGEGSLQLNQVVKLLRHIIESL